MRRTMRPQVSLLVAAAMLFAGCFGGGSDAAASEESPPPSPAEATGVVQGGVVDDEARPIPEATVRIVDFDREWNDSATTGNHGTFAFADVPPGKYRLSAEALFFKRATKDVEVTAGATSEVMFTLVDLVQSSLFVEVHPVSGYINCSVHSLGPYGPFNPCSAVADDTARFPLPLRDDLVNKGVVLELAWTPSTEVTGTDLELALCNEKDEVENPINCRETTGPGYFQNVRGKSPLVLRAQDLPLADFPAMEVTVGDGGQTSLRVPLTFQQSFELWMSLCYAENCPETYSALPPES